MRVRVENLSSDRLGPFLIGAEEAVLDDDAVVLRWVHRRCSIPLTALGLQVKTSS